MAEEEAVDEGAAAAAAAEVAEAEEAEEDDEEAALKRSRDASFPMRPNASKACPAFCGATNAG